MANIDGGYDKARVAALYATMANSRRTTTQRGRALESLAALMFSGIPGVTVLATNSRDVFACEEIDVVLYNVGDSVGLFGFDQIIPIECKNWREPVGALEVAWFDTKLRLRGLKTGILLALNGITGLSHSKTSAQHIVAVALKEERRLVILGVNELRSCATFEDLVSLCRTRLSQLYLSRSMPNRLSSIDDVI